MAAKPVVELKIGDRVKINSDGVLIRWGSIQPLNRAGGRTGKVVRVITRHLYYVQWDEPFIAAYYDKAIEKI
jgi:ribosomal protein L21E